MRKIIASILLFSSLSATLTIAQNNNDSQNQGSKIKEDHRHDPNALDLEALPEQYYHSHDGHTPHDLSMAYIAFDSDPIGSPAEITGRWGLEEFETTDFQMMAFMQISGYDMWLDVNDGFLQVTVKILSTGSEYQDAPIAYTIQGGQISVDSPDISIGYKNGRIVMGLLGMDEAYRYSFLR